MRRRYPGLCWTGLLFTLKCLRAKYKEMRGPASSEDSAAVRDRVIRARKRQSERFRAEKKPYSNGQMAPRRIQKYRAILAEGEKLVENPVSRLGLQGRAHDRILNVPRNNLPFGWRGLCRGKTFGRGNSVSNARSYWA